MNNKPVCPSCGCTNLETTCIGGLLMPGETEAERHARDQNKATCTQCGWQGRYGLCPIPTVQLRLIQRDPMQETEQVREWLRKASQLMTLVASKVSCGVDFIAAVDAPSPADEIARKV